jgi:hypothetical protein
MKKMMIVIVILAAVSSAHAAYTYTYGPGTAFQDLSLFGTDSILVNGGGGNTLWLSTNSTGRIESTSRTAFNPAFGIGQVGVGSSANLQVAGGEIGLINMWGSARATLSGGSITTLRWRDQAIPPQPVKRIDVVCQSYYYTASSQMLTGLWCNGEPFAINVTELTGYPRDFTYDSINFTIVPEPFTLGLLALGGLMVRSRRSRL